MRKLIYFVALSFGLFLLLSCVQALTDSLEVMTMDPADRQDYISLSDEEKDKYLQMIQWERDQFRADHDPEIIALEKQLDFAQRKLTIAYQELDKVSDPKEKRHVWKPADGGEGVVAKGPPPTDDRINPDRRTRWFMWEDNARKWQIEVKNLEKKLDSLRQQKFREYAEARAAWEAKNKQMSGPVSGGCFTPDTLVLMESGYKRIADIKAGDRVLSVDSKGNRAVNEVVRHYIRTNNHYYSINGTIKVTARHLFYTSDGDKRVQDLQAGDRIRMSDGTFEAIVSKERIAGDLTVYNLDVAENDNFFVSSDGARGYLVHNCGSK
jgi:hypothetical protein